MSSLVDPQIFKFHHPFTALISGPSGSGKTYFVQKLLRNSHILLDQVPKEIIWCYGVYQNWFSQFPSIQFHEGIPNLAEMDCNIARVLVVDDLMGEDDKSIETIFTKYSHHCNMSVFYLVQNLFHKSAAHRTASLNAGYIVIFRSIRDANQVSCLARQLYPRNYKFFMEAYEDATKSKPYSYLLIDLKPSTPDQYRIRTNIFPNDKNPMIIYSPKSKK